MSINKYFSYPKINLFLIVHKKSRKKELHKIDSLFLKYDGIYDEIEISNNNYKNQIYYFNSFNEKIVIQNCLINIVLEHFQKQKKIKNFYKIIIKKNIPFFSGLGGGSSNLAIVLKHIMKEEKIKFHSLKKDILKFSSDSFFFFNDYKLARVYSYGNKVKQINLDIKVSLFLNQIQCSTKEVFNKYDFLNIQNKTNFKKQIKFLKSKNYSLLFNSLKEPCFNLYPDLKCIYNSIVDKNLIPLLSGSGGTLFTIDKVIFD